MTFEDFGLNPDCNIYDGKKAMDIKNGVEYAKETLQGDNNDNKAVFVVDVLGRTVCVYREKDLEEPYVSATYDTSNYWDAGAMERRKSSYDVIGSWMMYYMRKLNIAKYGVIVQNSDGSFQVV